MTCARAAFFPVATGVTLAGVALVADVGEGVVVGAAVVAVGIASGVGVVATALEAVTGAEVGASVVAVVASFFAPTCSTTNAVPPIATTKNAATRPSEGDRRGGGVLPRSDRIVTRSSA